MNTHPSPVRAIVDQAWPMFVAQMAMIAGTAIDTAMAGRLSAVDLAGVALGANIYFSIFAAFMGIMVAVGPIAGHHFGAGRFHAIGEDVGQALWLAAFFSIIGIAALIWTEPWFALAQAPAEVTHITSGYLLALAVGLPAGLGSRVFTSLNSAVSRPRITMGINLAALALKVPLNLLFMHGAGPLPAFGGVGCGIASALLAWVIFGLSFAVWRLDPYFARFRSRSSLHWQGPVWRSQRELLTLGVPTGLATLFEVSSFTFMGILIARLGAATLGAHQIVANVVSILFMMPLSIGFAASALIAQSLGGGNPVQARQIAHRAVGLTVAVAAALAAIVGFGRMQIASLYTNNAEVAGIAVVLLALGASFHVFDAVQGICFQLLRGYKIATAPMLIYGFSLWGIGIGGGLWLAYSATPFGPPMGATGFWTASLFGLASASSLLLALLLSVAKRSVARA
jgi:MATE family multidrug resistance protein